jgi:hypothetical protein
LFTAHLEGNAVNEKAEAHAIAASASGFCHQTQPLRTVKP